MKKHLKISSIILSSFIISNSAIADDGNKFFTKIYGGISYLSDKDFSQQEVASHGASGTGEFSNGNLWGAAFGYQINSSFSTEISWDYRSNDNDSINFSDSTNFNQGNYASSVFMLNGYYHLSNKSKFQPYFGAGIGLLQEIDLDGIGSSESSYSQKNKFAYQLTIGSDYKINDNFLLMADMKYLKADNITLEEEGGSSKIQNIDYDPIAFAIGVKYRF